MDFKEQIIQSIEKQRDRFIAVSKQIWELAEVRFELPKSTRLVKSLLHNEGFKIDEDIAGMTCAFTAEYGSGQPVVGILAEFDALSNMSQTCGAYERLPIVAGGNGHGCGHHLLGIGAVAGAIGIKQHLESSGQQGTIRLFGCPAEESGYGKAFMARSGIFDTVDAFLTWHPWDANNLWSQSTLAVNQLYFNFKGVSSHAAAAPEMGRSALDAAELMNIGVNFLREHIIDDARIHYAFMDVGGTAANVVQATSSLHYFVRAPRQDQVDEIRERIVKIAQGAALMTETSLEIKWDGACANFVVNQTLGRAMYENMKMVFPLHITEDEAANYQRYRNTLSESVMRALSDRTRQYHPSASPEQLAEIAAKPVQADLAELGFPTKPLTASTDVGDPSWFAPTAQLMVACMPYGTAAHSWQWASAGQSPIAFKGMIAAAEVIALTALDLIDNPLLLKQAKQEHKANLSGKSYCNPVPLDVLPQ